MRFDEFTLRIPGDEFRMRFHPNLTVVAGIGELERAELLDSIVGALSGAAEGTTFSYVDQSGGRVVVNNGSGATDESGRPIPYVTDVLGVDTKGLAQKLRLDASDLGLRPGHAHLDQHPELRDARSALDEVTNELHTALATTEAADALREELGHLEEKIRQSDESTARRAYARVLADLERLKAEAAAVRSGSRNETTDKLLLERRADIATRAEIWRSSALELADASEAWGDRQPLTDEQRAEAKTFPDTAPSELERLSDRLDRLIADEAALVEGLREGAAAQIAEPSHPLVSELARLDQAVLWTANEAVIESRNRARAVSLGLSPDVAVGDLEAMLAELEDAHLDLERAMEEADEGKVKKMLAQRRAAEAEKRQEAVLAKLGLPSYMALHVRRLELSLDPDARESAEKADLESRLAEIRWRELAGDTDPVVASGLRDETENYAAAIASLDTSDKTLAAMRRRLDEEIRPAIESTRAALVDVCSPFGIDDTDMAVEMVSHQVELGRTARLQTRIEQARNDETRAAMALSDALFNVGFGDGDLPARLGAYEWAVERASERAEARTSARSIEELDAQIDVLERKADEMRQPGWSGVTPADAAGPEPDELRERRDATRSAYQAALALVPDLDRLRDRHKALTRRVEVLESDLRARNLLGTSPAEVAGTALMSLLTGARSAGPDGGPLPVVLDDPLTLVDRDDKAEMLELVERLAERVQILYFTEDPEVAAWARRKAGSSLLLLEPSPEPDPATV